MLAAHGATLDHVLELTVDDDAVVARLLKRAESEGRADDTEEVIRERMAIYHRETKPLSDTYRAHGLLVEVDGLGQVDEVTDQDPHRPLLTRSARRSSAGTQQLLRARRTSACAGSAGESRGADAARRRPSARVRAARMRRATSAGSARSAQTSRTTS